MKDIKCEDLLIYDITNRINERLNHQLSINIDIALDDYNFFLDIECEICKLYIDAYEFNFTDHKEIIYMRYGSIKNENDIDNFVKDNSIPSCNEYTIESI